MTRSEFTVSDGESGHVIRIQGVTKAFGSHEVLSNINLTVSKGQVLCLLGKSGSGKSTLLRCVNNLERPDRGIVWVAGERMGVHRRHGRLEYLGDRAASRQRSRVGMVFQNFCLFPNLTALQNVALAPIRVQRRTPGISLEEARGWLARVGLADHMNKYPKQMSGGQQQRVAIARALALQPVAILFDEPTSALDPELVDEVLTIIRGLADDGTTMMIVTHEVDFARDVADYVALLSKGRIAEFGVAADVLQFPREPETQEFLRTLPSPGHL